MSTPAVVRALVESAFRDFETPGVPASGEREPLKSEIRAALGEALEAALSSVGSGLLRFATVALMDADTNEANGALAYVFNNNDDPADAANGVYQWDDGASNWVVAPWYFNAVAAVVQPLVDEVAATATAAEGYRDELLPFTGKFSDIGDSASAAWGVGDADGRSPLFARPDGRIDGQGLVSSRDIVCLGDSLTFGQGATTGNTYPEKLADALGRSCVNLGIGGQNSTEIAARFSLGGCMTVTLDGNKIPASGPVDVTAYGIDIGWQATSSAQSWQDVVVAGVSGTLQGQNDGDGSRGSGTYVFARTTAGDAVDVPAGVSVIHQNVFKYAGRTAILWPGRNDTTADELEAAVLAMVEVLSPTFKRFLVLSSLNGAGEGNPSAGYTLTLAKNAVVQRWFPGAYIDVRRHLIDYGLTEAGITPTAQDGIDVAADTVPDSLRDDSIHLNDAGYLVVANFIARHIRARGWEDSVTWL